MVSTAQIPYILDCGAYLRIRPASMMGIDRKMRVRVDRSLCVGIGNCVGHAPKVFALDDENKAVVLDPSAVDEETLLQAAESCPENAIVVEDDEGRQIYP